MMVLLTFTVFVLFLESFSGGNVIDRLSQTEKKVELLFDQLQQQNNEIMQLKQIIANKEITRRADHIPPIRGLFKYNSLHYVKVFGCLHISFPISILNLIPYKNKNMWHDCQ